MSVQSWGRFPKVDQEVLPFRWRHEPIPELAPAQTVLPHGLGRSYGDSCLNDRQAVLHTRDLNRFISFDLDTGRLRCEAGVSLAQILDLVVSSGWFLPVTPGTKFVTVGGAIANDIHGKNHHCAGSFGQYVCQFELLRSTGERFLCSPTSNSGLFYATIGGLGITGLISWAELQMKPIKGPWIKQETVRFGSLNEFFKLSAESEPRYEYLVAWVDCLASASNLGRGIFIRGNHYDDIGPAPKVRSQPVLRVPIDFPSWVLNSWSIRCFNGLYYHRHFNKQRSQLVDYDPFFYPLDSILDWNRIYGKTGLLQWQCLVPLGDDGAAMSEILRRISKNACGSFLAVLKIMGALPSLGLMSFPRSGVTLALDFRTEPKVFSLLDELDTIVREAGGRIYPAKDARMTAASFQAFYPEWENFCSYVDPQFSSSFWRRVSSEC